MNIPLSERLRPVHLDEVYGQPHLIGEKGLLSKIMSAKKPLSILLYGPPGCGKTTIAKLYASAFDMELVHILPQASGTQEIKQHITQKQKHPLFNKGLMLFVDEIHRFNKQQQDLFLPFLEDGSIVLIAATTENPTFALNKALLSRLRVLRLDPLIDEALEKVISRFLLTATLTLSSDAKKALIENAGGDARKLLNTLESIETVFQGEVSLDDLDQLSLSKQALYDKTGDWHYFIISALHKSIRGSDVNAALYWLTRMLQGGEDPDFIIRRLLRAASEDIGLADPSALGIVLNCAASFERLGSPEGDLALAQAVIYLTLAPKSNSTYVAFGKAKKIAEKTSHLEPPGHLSNLNSPWDKKTEDYIYDHDTKDGFSGQNYFPEGLEPMQLYSPIERGFERELVKRLSYFTSLREKLKKEKTPSD